MTGELGDNCVEELDELLKKKDEASGKDWKFNIEGVYKKLTGKEPKLDEEKPLTGISSGIIYPPNELTEGIDPTLSITATIKKQYPSEGTGYYLEVESNTQGVGIRIDEEGTSSFLTFPRGFEPRINAGLVAIFKLFSRLEEQGYKDFYVLR